MNPLDTLRYTQHLHNQGFHDLTYKNEAGYDALFGWERYLLFIEQLPTTCSTVYLGNVHEYLYWSSQSNFKENLPKLTDFINDYLFKISGYTEVIVTIKNYPDVINQLLTMGFTPLGEVFKNKRTENELQHFHYMRKD